MDRHEKRNSRSSQYRELAQSQFSAFQQTVPLRHVNCLTLLIEEIVTNSNKRNIWAQLRLFE